MTGNKEKLDDSVKLVRGRIALDDDDDDDDVLGVLSLDSRISTSVFGINKMKLVELGLVVVSVIVSCKIDDDDVLGVLSLDSRISTSVFGINKMKLVELGLVDVVSLVVILARSNVKKVRPWNKAHGLRD
ncbi:hypothetical protein Tco_1210646 [Tanacetum coccineum]